MRADRSPALIDKGEVVIVDRVTAEPIVQGREVEPALPEHEVTKLEHETPDGVSAIAREHTLLPWIVGGLALAGLVIAAAGMYAVGGAQAALVGVAWISLGYVVAWIVVWGAGVIRAGEEKQIEERVKAHQKFKAQT